MSRMVTITITKVNFGGACVGVVRDASTGRKLAVGESAPAGSDPVAHQKAIELAAYRGWTVVEVAGVVAGKQRNPL